MKTFVVIIKIILAITLTTIGVNHLSQPSNLWVALGLVEIALAIILIYRPLKLLIKQL